MTDLFKCAVVKSCKPSVLQQQLQQASTGLQNAAFSGGVIVRCSRHMYSQCTYTQEKTWYR